MHQALAHTVQGLDVLLVEGFGWHRSQARAPGGFGDGGGIVPIILRALAEGDDVLRGDEQHLMTEFFELARPMLRAGASFHSNSAGGEVAEKKAEFIAMQTLV